MPLSLSLRTRWPKRPCSLVKVCLAKSLVSVRGVQLTAVREFRFNRDGTRMPSDPGTASMLSRPSDLSHHPSWSEFRESSVRPLKAMTCKTS